jgi:hypothetical protein
MTPLFADSFYFLALYNQHDAAHERAVHAASTIVADLVTTDWALTEVADALSSPQHRMSCVALIDDLRRTPHVEIVPATRELFDAGWELYGERPDKDWSLTDCISFAVMQDRNIADALTGDHHFVQAGFRAILR